MVVLFKHLVLVLVSTIIMVSGSGFATFKMLCLCSGDTTYSFTAFNECAETKTSETSNIPVLDHKCCDYNSTFIQLAKSVHPSSPVVADLTIASWPVTFNTNSLSFLFSTPATNTPVVYPPPIAPHQQKIIFLLQQNFRI